MADGDDAPADPGVSVSGDSDTLGSIPQFISPDHRHGNDMSSLVKSPTLTPALHVRQTTMTKSHLLRVWPFWTPTWCAVCSRTIIMGWMAQGKSFECLMVPALQVVYFVCISSHSNR